MKTGLGDVIKSVTEVIGIEQCEGCKKRQSLLNRIFPFRNITPPNKEEIEFLEGVFSWYKGLPIPREGVDDIIKCGDLWMKLFNVKTEPCRNCGATFQNNYMKDLERLYINYKDAYKETGEGPKKRGRKPKK